MMKLFAVGTTDPDPANWKDWEEVDLILADTAEQAKEIHGYPTDDVVEVDMRFAKRVMQMPPYDDGDM